jgi:2-hydroxymuconate-semialdehyde hydrolase
VAFRTNVHDVGSGAPVLLIHGSGPGVSAWANWRLVMPVLAKASPGDRARHGGLWLHRPPGQPGIAALQHGHLGAAGGGPARRLGIEQADLVGNSFGGALALALAIAHPSACAGWC